MVSLDVDLELDSLFQKHNIDELEGILMKIRSEADKKKFDLRRLVGDSYRDVIDAADAIGNMKSTTELLLEKLGLTADPTTSRNHNEKSGIDEQTLTTISSDGSDTSKSTLIVLYTYPFATDQLFGIAAKIKLLIITPEQIWYALEHSCFLNACKIYLIARLVFASLEKHHQSLQGHFPITKDLWDAIGPLKTQIIEKASKAIAVKNLSSEKTCECLCAISILNSWTLQDAFHLYLSLKKKNILDILSHNVSSSSDQKPENKVFGFISSVRATVKEVLDLFLSGVIGDYFKSQANLPKVSMSIFTEIYSENSNIGVLYRYLPQTIKHFSVQLNIGAPLGSKSVLELSSLWLKNMLPSLQERLFILFSKFSSGADLATFKTQFQSLSQERYSLEETNFMHVLESPLTIWSTFFATVYQARSESLIENTFHHFFSAAHDLIESEIEKEMKGDNFGYQLWFEKIEGASDFSVENFIKRASPRLFSLENGLSSAANSIINDLEPLLEAESGKDIQAPIYQSFKKAWDGFQSSYLSRLDAIQKNPSISSMAKVEKTLFLGKAVNSIEKQLKSIFKLIHCTDEQIEVVKKEFDELDLKSRSLWNEKLAEKASSILLDGCQGTNWDSCFTFNDTWEDIGDPNLKSFPAHPSLFVSNALFYICEEINRVDAFLMEKNCNVKCLDLLYSKISKSYYEFLSTECLISLNGRIQLLFDFSYISEIMGRLHLTDSDQPNRKSLNSSVVLNITKKIDPFVKTCVEKQLPLSLQKAVSRAGPLLNLICYMNLPNTSGGKFTTEKQHMLLPLAPTIPRFSLLPVATQLGISTARQSISAKSPLLSKAKPQSKLTLRATRKSPSDVPLGLMTNQKPAPNQQGASRGIMSGLAGFSSMAQPPKATTELLASASNFISGLGLGLASGQSPKRG